MTASKRFVVRPYRRHDARGVGEYFKVVDTATKPATTIRTGLTNEQDARRLADDRNEQETGR